MDVEKYSSNVGMHFDKRHAYSVRQGNDRKTSNAFRKTPRAVRYWKVLAIFEEASEAFRSYPRFTGLYRLTSYGVFRGPLDTETLKG